LPGSHGARSSVGPGHAEPGQAFAALCRTVRLSRRLSYWFCNSLGASAESCSRARMTPGRPMLSRGPMSCSGLPRDSNLKLSSESQAGRAWQKQGGPAHYGITSAGACDCLWRRSSRFYLLDTVQRLPGPINSLPFVDQHWHFIALIQTRGERLPRPRHHSGAVAWFTGECTSSGPQRFFNHRVGHGLDPRPGPLRGRREMNPLLKQESTRFTECFSSEPESVIFLD
jgi:hypothetical protein